MGQGEDLFGRLFERGEVVFRQGDPGDAMYLVQSGAVEISRRTADGETVLALLEAGACFGEMALLDNRPRSTDARAAQRTRLASFTRTSLLVRLKSDPGVAMHLLKVLCRRIEETNRLHGGGETLPEQEAPSAPEAAALADPWGLANPAEEFLSDLQPTEQLPGGAIVFRQGQPGDAAYILLEGSVRIFDETAGSRYLIGTLGPGELFGEMALISENPRSATVETASPASLLRISREEFLRRIAAEPQLGLALLRLLTVRLRRTLAGAPPAPPAPAATAPLRCALPVRREGRIRVGFVNLSSCAGCSAILLEEPEQLADLLGRASIEYSSLLRDRQELGAVDVCIVEGLVRMRQDLHALEQARARSRVLVAWGTCAVWGGIPALANRFIVEDLVAAAYGGTDDLFSRFFSGSRSCERAAQAAGAEGLLRRAGTIDEHVRVDYCVPGCPPPAEHLGALLRELAGAARPARKLPNICAECPRATAAGIPAQVRLFPPPGTAAEQCLLSQGVFCCGPVSRGGCAAPCPSGGLPCWGCRGPSDILLQKITHGESYESALLATVARRAKIEPSQWEPLLKTLRSRANTLLGFAPSVAVDPGTLR